MVGSNDDRSRSRRGSLATAGLVVGLALGVAVSAATVSAESAAPKDVYSTKSFWANAAKPGPARGRNVVVHAQRFRPLTLDTARLASVLARAPRERTASADANPLLVSLPAANGKFQLFALQESAIMAPGLARRHPEIKTYSGRGITDPSATIHADLTPLGFRASIRSTAGVWYIDPYFVGRNPTLYASYYGRDAKSTNGTFVEREIDSAELAVEQGRPNSTGDLLRIGDREGHRRTGVEARAVDGDRVGRVVVALVHRELG